jgi:hypothetical protein
MAKLERLFSLYRFVPMREVLEREGHLAERQAAAPAQPLERRAQGLLEA